MAVRVIEAQEWIYDDVTEPTTWGERLPPVFTLTHRGSRRWPGRVPRREDLERDLGRCVVNRAGEETGRWEVWFWDAAKRRVTRLSYAAVTPPC